ncbi:MAG: hypothetical protein AAFN27_21825 [Pseudomonadota bacterium]
MFTNLFGFRKSRWLTEESVRAAMRAQSTRPFASGSHHHCLSSESRYAVLVREHAAWVVPESGIQKWRYGNFPPKRPADSREIVNVFKLSSTDGPGYWFKTILPTDVRITDLRTTPNTISEFCLEMDRSTHLISWSDLDKLMWILMTGEAQSQADIVENFNRFIGASA